MQTYISIVYAPKVPKLSIYLCSLNTAQWTQTLYGVLRYGGGIRHLKAIAPKQLKITVR